MHSVFYKLDNVTAPLDQLNHALENLNWSRLKFPHFKPSFFFFYSILFLNGFDTCTRSLPVLGIVVFNQIQHVCSPFYLPISSSHQIYKPQELCSHHLFTEEQFSGSNWWNSCITTVWQLNYLFCFNFAVLYVYQPWLVTKNKHALNNYHVLNAQMHLTTRL